MQKAHYTVRLFYASRAFMYYDGQQPFRNSFNRCAKSLEGEGWFLETSLTIFSKYCAVAFIPEIRASPSSLAFFYNNKSIFHDGHSLYNLLKNIIFYDLEPMSHEPLLDKSPFCGQPLKPEPHFHRRLDCANKILSLRWSPNAYYYSTLFTLVKQRQKQALSRQNNNLEVEYWNSLYELFKSKQKHHWYS